jgi:hypothetical protein
LTSLRTKRGIHQLDEFHFSRSIVPAVLLSSSPTPAIKARGIFRLTYEALAAERANSMGGLKPGNNFANTHIVLHLHDVDVIQNRISALILPLLIRASLPPAKVKRAIRNGHNKPLKKMQANN